MRIGNFLITCMGAMLDRELVVKREHGIEQVAHTPLVIIFSDLVLPIQRTNKSRIITVINNETIIPYRKRVTRAEKLDIEEKTHVCSIGAIEGDKIVVKHIYDRSIVPDYTTIYIVLGLCGGAIVAVVSAFSKSLLGFR